MAEIIFLKTTAFGGYDKEDVDKRLEALYSQIYELRNQLSNAETALGKYKTGSEQEKIYESVVADERAKITQLQVENQKMSEMLESIKAENQQKNEEISVLREELHELEQDISEANTTIASLNASDDVTAMSIVFAEAKKSADVIISNAKSKAEELETNSKKLAEDIIKDANKKASEIIAGAESDSKQMEVASGNMKALMLDDVNKINQVFSKLKETFEEFQKSGCDILGKSEKMLSETKNTLESNGVPVFHVPEDFKPELPDAPANDYDDSDFMNSLDSVNLVSDNFMDDFQENLENELLEFETGRVNARRNENISIEELVKQAQAINDGNNKNKKSVNLDELAKQAQAINDSNNKNKKSGNMNLDDLVKQAQAINNNENNKKKSDGISLEELAKQAESI